MKTMKIIY